MTLPIGDITVRHLEYFSAAYRAGSISRAAEALFLSQPALSRQIADLERLCGVALLHRQPAGVTPTSAGHALFQHARTVLRLVDASAEVARSVDPAPERVVVGLAPGLDPAWIGDLIRACRAAAPHAELDLVDASSTEHLRRLRDGQLDLAIVHQRPIGELNGVLLRTDPIGVALEPSLTWTFRDSVPLCELDGLRVLIHARGQLMSGHDVIVQAANEVGVHPEWRPASYVENAAACARATGAVVSVQTESTAKRLLPDWHWFPLIEPAVDLESWLVAPRDLRPTVQKTVSAMQNAMRQLQSREP